MFRSRTWENGKFEYRHKHKCKFATQISSKRPPSFIPREVFRLKMSQSYGHCPYMGGGLTASNGHFLLQKWTIITSRGWRGPRVVCPNLFPSQVFARSLRLNSTVGHLYHLSIPGQLFIAVRDRI